MWLQPSCALGPWEISVLLTKTLRVGVQWGKDTLNPNRYPEVGCGGLILLPDQRALGTPLPGLLCWFCSHQVFLGVGSLSTTHTQGEKDAGLAPLKESSLHPKPGGASFS